MSLIDQEANEKVWYESKLAKWQNMFLNFKGTNCEIQLSLLNNICTKFLAKFQISNDSEL